MNCKDIDRLLNDHKLSQLTAAERSRFDAHLAECSRCAQAVSIQEMLTRDPVESPRAGLLASISQQIAEPPRVRRPESTPRPWIQIGGLAVAGALSVLVVLGLVVGQPDEVPGDSGLEATVAATGVQAEPPVLANTPVLTPEPFFEGQHFVTLPGDALLTGLGNRVSVWVFFMWSCGFCYELEAHLSNWVAANDTAEIEIFRVPVQWNPVAVLHARAYFAAHTLGVFDDINGRMFEAIHESGSSLSSRNELADVFGDVGIEPAVFHAAMDSPAVEAAMSAALRVSGQFGIESVPGIIVDGRYLVSPAMTESYDEMFEVVDWLVADAHSMPRPDSATSSSLREIGFLEVFQQRFGRQGTVADHTGEPVDIPDNLSNRQVACPPTSSAALADRIQELRDELESLLTRYTEQYPSVVSARQELERLEAERRERELQDLDDCIVIFQQPGTVVLPPSPAIPE